MAAFHVADLLDAQFKCGLLGYFGLTPAGCASSAPPWQSPNGAVLPDDTQPGAREVWATGIPAPQPFQRASSGGSKTGRSAQ